MLQLSGHMQEARPGEGQHREKAWIPCRIHTCITRDDVPTAQRAALLVLCITWSMSCLCGQRAAEQCAHSSMGAQGRHRAVTPAHSLSTGQRSPDICIRKMGSTRTSHISRALPGKSWDKLSAFSIQHSSCGARAAGDKLVTHSSFSRVHMAPPGCRHMQEAGMGIPRPACAAEAVLQPPSPRAWPETLLSASHGFQRQIGTFLCPGSLQNSRP